MLADCAAEIAAHGRAQVTDAIRAELAAIRETRPDPLPDAAAIRGTNPVRVDVLANDADPQGGLLTVQAAESDAAAAADEA